MKSLVLILLSFLFPQNAGQLQFDGSMSVLHSVLLTFQPGADQTDPTVEYDVLRSNGNSDYFFVCSPDDITVTPLTCVDSGVPSGQWYYAVLAYDQFGLESSMEVIGPVTVP